MSSTGHFDPSDYAEVRKIYSFMFHTRFKTTATVTFDSDDKLKIEIEAVHPTTWAEMTGKYPFLKAFGLS